MLLPAGLNAHVELTVTEADTAVSLGSGDVAVLATPNVVALCEKATVGALGPHLEPGQTSVGYRVEITHVAPVLVGRTVVATAALERVEGKRITFHVTVNDKCGLIAAGKVTRVLVERDSFMDKAR